MNFSDSHLQFSLAKAASGLPTATMTDAASWPHWASVITNVTWTCPEPRGVGTTRTVDMRGGIVGDEECLMWEPFNRMAFRFATTPRD
jgi:hypothetical protein